MKYTELIIGFAPSLVPLVLNGSKTLTYRLGDKWGFLKIGDIISAKDSEVDKLFAELEIVNIESVTFGDLSNNSKGHEVYETDKEKRMVFSKYYTRTIKNDESVLILEFKVLSK